MIVTLDQYNIGETSPVILYIYINWHAGTPNKTKTKDAMSLGYSSSCYVGSRIGWVSMKGVFESWDVAVIMENCPTTILIVHTYK